MDYFITVWSVVVFVENRLQGKFDYGGLINETGFSLAHIRDLFVKRTGTSLAKYILTRKINNAAFDILHTNQNVVDIAMKYGFTNHDTFTRAFKRITGLTPAGFRKYRPAVGRVRLCAGVYGIGLLKSKEKDDD